jgi:hypothetical protein
MSAEGKNRVRVTPDQLLRDGDADWQTVMSPPVVVSTTPANLATKVSRTISPTATFDDEMNPETLDNDTVKLYVWNTKKRVWKVVRATISTSGKTVTIEPVNTLAAKKRHMVTITKGAENVAGLQLENPTSWVFVTGKR